MIKKGYVITALLMLASLLIGIVIGATIFGTIEFSYKISSGIPSMNPSSISIDLGDLVPDQYGHGGNATGFATINVTADQTYIKHTLGGDLDIFDEFSININYYQDYVHFNMRDLSLDDKIQSMRIYEKGICQLEISYSYHIKADVLL